MSTLDKCKNCGGDRGIHHYETDQCPVGGREAPIKWKLTTFELENDYEVEELRKSFTDLLARFEKLEAQVERLQSGSELEESVRAQILSALDALCETIAEFAYYSDLPKAHELRQAAEKMQEVIAAQAGGAKAERDVNVRIKNVGGGSFRLMDDPPRK